MPMMSEATGFFASNGATITKSLGVGNATTVRTIQCGRRRLDIAPAKLGATLHHGKTGRLIDLVGSERLQRLDCRWSVLPSVAAAKADIEGQRFVPRSDTTTLSLYGYGIRVVFRQSCQRHVPTYREIKGSDLAPRRASNPNIVQRFSR